MSERRAEAGFTLIELMVALGVLSIAVLALLNATGESVRAEAVLRQRLLAEIVAENQLIQALAMSDGLKAGTSKGEAEMGGVTWSWTRAVAPTQDRALQKIDITVTQAGESATRAQLSGFRRAQ